MKEGEKPKRYGKRKLTLADRKNKIALKKKTVLQKMEVDG